MKKYIKLTNLGIAFCTIGFILVILNLLTGVINSTMTSGASAVCLSSLAIALYILIQFRNSKRSI